MSKVGGQLIQVIRDNEFKNITKDLVESAIDTNLAEGFLKDVPFLSTIISSFNLVTNIKDRLFVKKLLTFLYELKSISEDEILDQIIELEDSNKYRTKVGEKLLYIIDKCEDPDKASLTGLLFKSYLEKKIDYDEFLTASNTIERTPLPDLLYFIDNDFDDWGLDSGGSEYVSYGLMEIRVSKPEIKVSSDSRYDYDEKYAPSEEEILQDKIDITGFDIKACVSWNGRTIRKCLANR
ncbi:hypothetical protein [Chitinophaga sp. ARDCPP14]|uniref:hypothetical protein n=1 Tax=Chitinophaga sp. ARDCPP14 TaxID=3391139 RepID=UPI003F520B8C